MKQLKRLYRSYADRKIAGVCGGLAQYFGVDSTIVRLIVVILALATTGFPVLTGYIIAIFIIPEEQDIIE